MIQKLLFKETQGEDIFDVTKTKLSISTLVDDYRKKEALAFESEKR
jgi:hypothetical protein